jgi:hypothetical protein
VKRVVLGCGVVLAAAGCELREVTIPGGNPVVVVQAVMRPDQAQQFVLVERAFDGVIDPRSEGGAIPPDLPQTPLESAMVSVTNLDLPTDPCGTEVLFDRRPINAQYFPVPGVYWGPAGCPTMRPGDRLVLRVETPAGEIVTGETVVPGFQRVVLQKGAAEVDFGADTTTFNRDRDTLRVSVVGPAVYRALQVEVRRLGDLADLSLLAFVDSSAVTLPGDIRHLFFRGTGEDTFRGGRRYLLVAGLADSNYFDFVRSRSSALTGRGFINRLRGGVGVFGSLVAVTHVLHTVADADDSREGRYRLQGRIQGVDVDAELEVYLERSVENSDLSAFLSGTWLELVEITAGVFWRQREVDAQSVDGRFDRDSLQVVVLTFLTNIRTSRLSVRLVLTGVRGDGPFAVTVSEESFAGRSELGSLTATRQ